MEQIVGHPRREQIPGAERPEFLMDAGGVPIDPVKLGQPLEGMGSLPVELIQEILGLSFLVAPLLDPALRIDRWPAISA